jgi:hypothetical protein
MKKFFNVIGYILIIPVGAFFALLILSGGIGFLLLYVLPVRTLAAIMRAVRKDPRVEHEITEAHDSDWQTANTPEEFIESFNKLLNVISGKSGVNVDKLKQEGFEEIPSIEEDDGHVIPLRLENTLHSTHGSLTATLEFVYTKYNESYVAGLEDEDSRSGSGFPELQMEWKSSTGQRLLFTTSTDESLWFAIGLLISGHRLSKAGQAWVYLEQMKPWLVNYTVIRSDKSDRIGVDYGSRRNFSEERTHQYWLDE